MYRKFDVTGNLLFAQYFFLEVNTALFKFEREREEKMETNCRYLLQCTYLLGTTVLDISTPHCS
jgi:hypothetical protein